jgi:DNA-directed RNA polymerase subunit beta'
VVGPHLKLNQCGLPKRIALELFQPFIIRKLKDRGYADTIQSAKRMLERREEYVWDILEEVIHQHPVMLNRAPTLHRMGIQAFEPVLVEGNAIMLHPLVCHGFNADFDGDQMAVHLPLSIEAQVEAHTLILSTNNIFSPASGSPMLGPSQDMVLGNFYITHIAGKQKGEGMMFRNMAEAITALDMNKVGVHARVKVRLPEGKKVVGENGPEKGHVIWTTPGRCLFNDILDSRMPFYNMTLDKKRLGVVVQDCYEYAGAKATLDLLDNMKELGFKRATLSGMSFGLLDLRIPPEKPAIIDATQKKVDKIAKNFQSGILTEGERYNQIIDVWTHARVAVTNAMMNAMRNDTRDGIPYLNPIWVMRHSGARGSIDQIQQLAGMRALMAKPSGEIIETPIKANFREGLNVLEYFSSTHGARKGLADTALKTADSGYLTRKLADVAQNMMISEQDCNTPQGITKSTVYKGETVDVPLKQLIIGRTARDNIRNPITDEMIVRENEVITPEAAEKIEQLGLDAIRVRSPLTCESKMGICAKCYGWDLSTSHLAEEGLAVGIIAAQSIGEPGTQLTMRTFHTGGIASVSLIETDQKATRDGIVKYVDLNAVETEVDGAKLKIALRRSGEMALVDEKGRELERFKVPYGGIIMAQDEQKVKKGERLFAWDPHRVSILAEVPGFVRLVDVIDGETMRVEEERKGQKGRPVIIEHKGDKHPQVIIEDGEGKILDVHYLPAKARIEVDEGQQVDAGTLMARLPRGGGGTQDITGGLPRVTEIFEARKPKDPAAMAEISGIVELKSDKRRGKMTIIIRNESGMEKEHHVPRDRHLTFHTSDRVEAGDALTDGPLVPHDILRIKGEEALQRYLLREIQNVYRAQSVTINDKHVEMILSQMMNKVEIESIGDSQFLPGEVIDKADFRKACTDLAGSLRVAEPGDTDLKVGQLVTKEQLEAANEKVEALSGTSAKGKKPRSATAATLLLGITKASLQSDSFISAASFQETTKVLTEASLAGKIDDLLGLKENVILGHLIPAGTAFKRYLDAKVKHMGEPPVPKQLEELREAKEVEAAKDKAVKAALGLE